MSVTERVMAAGDWSVTLSDETPRSLLEAIDVEKIGFSTLVILPTRLDPRVHTDADLLALARYTGIYRRQEGMVLSGAGLPILMGDEDGKGDVFESERSTSNGWLTEWVPVLRPLSLAAGTVTSPGGSYTDSFFLVTAKEAFETVNATFGTEWRITPDLKLHVGTPAALYGSTPALIVLADAGEGGRDISLTGVAATAPLSVDLEDYASKVVVPYDAETKVAVAEVSEHPYRRPTDGGPMLMDKLISAGTDDDTDPQVQADAALETAGLPRREVTVQDTRYDLGLIAPVGSYVWLFAPPMIMDTSNPVTFRGRACYPVPIRLMGMTWPVTIGSGVYLRTMNDAGVATWRDLTDYVVWEDGDVGLEVGALPRRSDSGVSPITPGPDLTPLEAATADSGWQPHGGTMSSYVTVVTAFMWRRIGNRVFWRGQCYKPSGWVLNTDNTVISGLPSKIRPATASVLACSSVGVYTAIMQTNGSLTIYPQFATGGYPIVSGSYALD